MGVLDRDCNSIAFGDDGILENICKSNFNSVSLGFVVSLVAVLAAAVLGLRLRGAAGGAASGDSRTTSALAAIRCGPAPAVPRRDADPARATHALTRVDTCHARPS